jgi:S-methylmethionine-dependent homocysteine/selenocysteine methylase
MVTLLDGPIGTRLEALGVPTPAPMWSAAAVRGAPSVLWRLHHDYAAAGATVHTAATFRTRPDDVGPAWAELAAEAVAIARAAVSPAHRIAGSVAPIADCWRPDLSPSDARSRHAAFVQVLAPMVDLLLCETFVNVREALDATAACVETGRPTWTSFTAGFRGDLLTPAEFARAGEAAFRAGAERVLINCVPDLATLGYLRAVAGCGPIGAYANVQSEPELYADYAEAWVDAGATVVGACCGGDVRHIQALSRRFHGLGRQVTPGP